MARKVNVLAYSGVKVLEKKDPQFQRMSMQKF